MNENMGLEELKQQLVVWQQQVSAIQQRIEEIEKETSQKEEKKTPWQLADIGCGGYFVDACLAGTIVQGERCTELDNNAFAQQSVAQGFANAFSVMIQLRQCEGAGERAQYGSGWLVDSSGELDWWDDSTHFGVFPPFPNKEKALAAAQSIGIDRIISAYKFLASGE